MATRPRRILFLDHTQTGTVGGALTGLLHLIRGLDPARYESILVLYEPKDLGGALDGTSCRVITLDASRISRPAPGRGGNTTDGSGWGAQVRRALSATRRLVQQKIPRARMLLPVLQRERPDLIHAGNSFIHSVDVLLAARWAGIPCVVHEKGLVQYSVVERIVARLADACICMTEAVRTNIERQGVRGRRTMVVYDGLDLAWFRPQRSADAVRAELDIGDRSPLIGITGHINPWKGQDVLLRAVGNVVGEFPHLGCLVVGGTVRGAEGYRAELERIVADRHLERHVRFVGARSDVPDLVGALDVLVHASVKPEPFGRVLIEGMALGKPLIATWGGGAPEIVMHEETGLLVELGDVDGMAAALRRLLGDPALRARFGAAGAERARTHFSLEAFVAGVEAVYDAVLSDRDSSATNAESH